MNLLNVIIEILTLSFILIILSWIIDEFFYDKIVRWFYDENPKTIEKKKLKNPNYNSFKSYKEWDRKHKRYKGRY